jgi:hypothetical protein
MSLRGDVDPMRDTPPGTTEGSPHTALGALGVLLRSISSRIRLRNRSCVVLRRFASSRMSRPGVVVAQDRTSDNCNSRMRLLISSL